jgi:hypothetical protein
MSWALSYPLTHSRRRHCTTTENLQSEISAHTWILQNTPKDVLSTNEQFIRERCIQLCKDELKAREW